MPRRLYDLRPTKATFETFSGLCDRPDPVVAAWSPDGGRIVLNTLRGQRPTMDCLVMLDTRSRKPTTSAAFRTQDEVGTFSCRRWRAGLCWGGVAEHAWRRLPVLLGCWVFCML